MAQDSSAEVPIKHPNVGAIPEDWGVGTISDVSRPPESGYSANGLDREAMPGEKGVLRLNCIERGRFVPGKNKAVVEFTELEKLKTPVLPDTIVISRSNTEDLVGVAAYVEKRDPNLFLSDLMWQLRKRRGIEVSFQWLNYLLGSPIVRSRLIARANGTSGSMKKITKPSLMTIRIPIPPLPEQKKIAEILSTWDEAIDRTREMIDAKLQQKKALMQQLLTGERRLPGYERRWEDHPIGRLFKVVSRPVDWDDDETYSLLSVRRRSGGVFLREEKQGSEIKTKVMFRAHAGDFLISRMQVVHGATGLVPDDLNGCHISGSYIVLKPRREGLIHPGFFNRLSTTSEFYHLTYLSSYGVHIEKMTFNLDWFLKSEISIPVEIAEQEGISEILDTADAEIAKLEAKVQALQLQKKGLMQKLLTGQIRVKE